MPGLSLHLLHSKLTILTCRISCSQSGLPASCRCSHARAALLTPPHSKLLFLDVPNQHTGAPLFTHKLPACCWCSLVGAANVNALHSKSLFLDLPTSMPQEARLVTLEPSACCRCSNAKTTLHSKSLLLDLPSSMPNEPLLTLECLLRAAAAAMLLNQHNEALEMQVAHMLVKLLAPFLQVWLSPWQVAHVLSIASFVNSTLQSVMGPESPTQQQAPTQMAPAPAVNSAIKMQLRLRLSFELALLSVLCSVSLTTQQVNMTTGCRHYATSTWGMQVLLGLRSSPELALLAGMSSY